jgi:hypothetical protein
MVVLALVVLFLRGGGPQPIERQEQEEEEVL